MKKDPSCIFCKIIDQQVPSYKVYEDDDFYGFLSIQPNTKGHTVLVPKVHSEEFLEVPNELFIKYMLVGKSICEKMKSIFKPKKVACVFAGLQVSHTHLNIFPANHPEDFNATAPYDATKEELTEMQKLLS